MTDYNSHMQSIEAKDVVMWGTLIATHDDHTTEDEEALKAAINAFQAIGGSTEQVATLLGQAAQNWKPHKGDQVKWENDHYVIHEVTGDVATIHDPLDDATENVPVSSLTLDLAYDDFSALCPYG